MKLFSTLRSRIFLASSVLAILCIATAIFIVNAQVTREAERTLEREIVTTSAQVDQLRSERAQTFTLMARLIADLPKLKAAMATDDPPTVQDIAGGYHSQLNANLVLVTNKTGTVTICRMPFGCGSKLTLSLPASASRTAGWCAAMSAARGDPPAEYST